MNVLFVTHDGPGSDYLSSLYLPMLARLPWSAHVFQITYGPRGQEERARLCAQSLGVGYRAIRIKPVGGRLGLASLGAAIALPHLALEIRRTRASVVIARSVLPAALVLLAQSVVGRRFGFVFDADGLPQDERVDFAGWSKGGVRYRGLRSLEVQALLLADAVLTRTHRAKDILLARAGPLPTPEKIHVVPNGSDENKFRPLNEKERWLTRQEYGLSRDGPVLVYTGSIGPQYLPETMFALLRRLPGAQFFVASAPSEGLRRLAAEAPAESVRLGWVEPSEMPRVLGAADLGLALRQPSFSQQAVSPIKVGEYLLCGLPVLATSGVGDLDRFLADSPAALMISEPSDHELDRAGRWVTSSLSTNRPAVRQSARSLGLAHFTLGKMASGYGRAVVEAVKGL